METSERKKKTVMTFFTLECGNVRSCGKDQLRRKLKKLIKRTSYFSIVHDQLSGRESVSDCYTLNVPQTRPWQPSALC